jgi:hypothetical protein
MPGLQLQVMILWIKGSGSCLSRKKKYLDPDSEATQKAAIYTEVSEIVLGFERFKFFAVVPDPGSDAFF